MSLDNDVSRLTREVNRLNDAYNSSLDRGPATNFDDFITFIVMSVVVTFVVAIPTFPLCFLLYKLFLVECQGIWVTFCLSIGCLVSLNKTYDLNIKPLKMFVNFIKSIYWYYKFKNKKIEIANETDKTETEKEKSRDDKIKELRDRYPY